MKSFNIGVTIIFIIILVNLNFVLNAENEPKSDKKRSWKEKDVRDMNDADLEHLYEQWEEDEEPLEPDELPEHLRPSPQIDLSKLDFKNPDNVLKLTKKGKGVMMFVNVRPEIPVAQADIAMRIWHSSLQNNHIIAERYPIEDRRCIYLFPDGSQAVDAKNFLIEQPELDHVDLEGQVYKSQYAIEDTEKKINAEKAEKTEL